MTEHLRYGDQEFHLDEAYSFDLDETGRICRVEIYWQTPQDDPGGFGSAASGHSYASTTHPEEPDSSHPGPEVPPPTEAFVLVRRTLEWIPGQAADWAPCGWRSTCGPTPRGPRVGGDFDGALVVRVVEPADAGRATEAALSAVAAAVAVPRRSVSLVRGARSRRKLVEVEARTDDARRVQAALSRLHAAAGG